MRLKRSPAVAIALLLLVCAAVVWRLSYTETGEGQTAPTRALGQTAGRSR